MRHEEETQADYVPWWRSRRFALAVVGFLGFLNLYALRVNMSVAMVCMVNQTAIVKDHMVCASGTNGTAGLDSRQGAPLNDSNCGQQTNDRLQEGEFAWSKPLQGVILGSFFWGYLITQIPGGWLAQRYSGKRVFGYFMLLAAVATLLTPIGSRASPYVLIALRIIIGIGQGVVFPAMHSLWSKWAPRLERSKLIGFTYAGAQIGNVVTLPVSAVLCDSGVDGGWPMIFYVFGAGGILWFILWMLVAADSPAEHARISHYERNYIESSIAAPPGTKRKTPWTAIFRSKAMWAIIAGHMGSNWGTYTLLTNIPTYMREVLHFDIKSNGLYSAIPFVMFWACINAAGASADALLTRGWKTANVRKIAQSLGNLFPAIFLVATGYVDHTNPYSAVTLLTLAMGFSGFQYSGVMVNHVDIAPQYAGVLFGISNTAATLPGIAAPYVIGVITSNQTQREWQAVFYISAGVYVAGWAAFLLLSEGEVQSWAELGEDEGREMKTVPANTAFIPNNAEHQPATNEA